MKLPAYIIIFDITVLMYESKKDPFIHSFEPLVKGHESQRLL